MSSNNKLGLLSMCRKAGRLSMGMDMMKDACAVGNSKGVFVASDLSEKSLKEVRFTCAGYSVKLFALDMTMDEISDGIGKRTGIISVNDSGFAKSCAKGLTQIQTDMDEFF